MSNPKEKAEQLYTHMFECVINPELTQLEMETMAISCALIAIDEIRSCINWNHYPLDKEWRFWDEVKQEIEKL
jgi:hypothetical protein